MPYPIRHPRLARLGDLMSAAGQWLVTVVAVFAAALVFAGVTCTVLLVVLDLLGRP